MILRCEPRGTATARRAPKYGRRRCSAEDISKTRSCNPLQLDPAKLKAVQVEGVRVLPGIPVQGGVDNGVSAH